MRAAVIVFPGSNCDQDCVRSLKAVTGLAADLVWHKQSRLPAYDLVILPGGFAHGDYLRCGAIARFSPVMAEVRRLANRGSLILGVCNGFQILCEAKLLPGALLRNHGLKYLCQDVHLRVETSRSPFTSLYQKGQTIRVPISHGEGSYTLNPRELKKLNDEDRVAFRYAHPDGSVTPAAAPNGSLEAIAGILSPGRNILGLMPHPERLAEPELGGVDGRPLFEAIFSAMGGAA
ncbi:MAG: phosphoribosylformylglycinamidine synthase subunit PurQ [Deltaproteobacteria bacterium]|jgi:phosphoribosylformylglycinamidine synthase|nr:phosphoribosylformylglycinamidine synthase subunit PurQ [Deltaproteobacteria bacterium]